MRQKLASLSEPEATPRTSLAGSPLMSSSQKAASTYSGHSSGGSSRRRSGATNSTTIASNLPIGAFTTRTTASSPPVGLGLGISPGSSPLSAFPRRRASRRRASSANDALASSAELQAATGIASGDEEDLGGPHNHLLASRAWLSRSGALKLVTPAVSKAVELQDAQVSATEDLDPDDSGIVVLPSPVRKQARELCREVIATPLDVGTASGDGFENASRAGWGSRAHNEMAATTSRPALLERVMKSKRSPRRLRMEAKERKRAAAIVGAGSPTRQRTLTDDEKAVLELAAEAKGASGSNSAELASEWTMPTTSTTSQARQSALHPSLPINETQAVHRRDESSSHPRTESQSLHFRKATHSRQMSQAGKTVRWAPNVAASPMAHQRMTTRDHYEFFVHGIAPGQSGLGDLDVEQDITPSASAQDTMPWLFPSHAQSSPIRRRPSFVSDDLAIDLSSMIEGDFDDVSAADLFNPRRGLLFTGSGIIQQSPSQHRGSVSAGGSSWSTPGVRFNPGFSDPSLSQSPARPLLAHMASSPARFSFGSATKPHGYTGARLGSISGPGAAFQPARQLFAASPTNPRSRGMAGSLAHADTISPAAVFGGGGGVIPQQIPFVRPHLRLNSSAQAANGTMSQPLPEPTKHWGRIPNDDGDGDGDASIIGDTNVSAAHLMGSPALRRDSSLRLMAGSDGVAQVVMVDAEPQFVANASAGLPSADKKSSAKESSTPSSSQSTKKKSKKAGQAATSTTSSSSSSQQSAPASSQPSQSEAAGASVQQLQSAQPPPNADLSQSEWTRDDGSKVVKLVSEELQAAIDAGGSNFKEPPPRYYVLPAGAGSTNAKPSHVSYAGLIGQAILTSSDGRLSLNEIYQWINTVHPYYERGDRGWQNSIRHNLSLNKSFMKVERDANFPGKGGWWAIKPGHEDRFHDGLYSAVPTKSSAGATSVSAPVSGASASKKKKASGATSSTDTPGDYSHDTGSSQWQSSPMPQPAATTQQGHPEATANRKRQTTGGDVESPLSSPSRQQGNDSRRKGSKSLKKPKLGAIGMSNKSSSGEGEDESFNVNNVARVPFASIGNRQQAVPTYHTVPYGGMLVSSTPHRPDQAPYMSSSTHGGSQSGGGMPMLTDSASSPPSSPPPMSDNAMPPPSSLGPMSSKKGRQHSGLNAAAMYGGANLMHYGGPGSSGVNHDGIMQHSYGFGAGNNPFYGGGGGGGGGGNGMFYATQPSPLANRLRGGHGASNSSTGGSGPSNGASPLRRQAIPTSSPGSPGKVASPPVSSVRDMSWSAQPGAGSNASSSLAGALNLRGPGKSGKGGGAAGGGGGGEGGNRNTNRQRGGASNQAGAPHRGSPLRRSTGSPLRSQQQHSLAHQHQQPPSGQSSAGAQLQMAMQQGLSNGSSSGQGEFGSMGPSLGGLGLGFTTNLTPSRVTPNAGGYKTMMHAISPSPTTRRFQQQQQASGWLEDPFNYQGALQHELDNMGGSGGSHGGHGSGGHGSNVLSMGSSGSNIGGQSGQWGAVDMTPMRGGGSSWSSATAGMTPSTMESLSAVRGGREAGYHRAD